MSPTLFVRLQLSYCKNKIKINTQIVKALTDSKTSELFTRKWSSKGLNIFSRTEIKIWRTATGRLTTISKTKNSIFSLSELNASKSITQSIHVVAIGTSRYDMTIGQD